MPCEYPCSICLSSYFPPHVILKISYLRQVRAVPSSSVPHSPFFHVFPLLDLFSTDLAFDERLADFWCYSKVFFFHFSPGQTSLFCQEISEKKHSELAYSRSTVSASQEHSLGPQPVLSSSSKSLESGLSISENMKRVKGHRRQDSLQESIFTMSAQELK